MITVMKGSDLLAVKRGLIVHGCNAVGVMGAGVAAQVAMKWPKSEKNYVDHCDTLGVMAMGTLSYDVLHRLKDSSPELILVNAITQRVPGIGKQVSYDAVDECFSRIAPLARTWCLPIHFPLIGCGLAGGKWPIIASIIEENTHGIETYLHVL